MQFVEAGDDIDAESACGLDGEALKVDAGRDELYDRGCDDMYWDSVCF